MNCPFCGYGTPKLASKKGYSTRDYSGVKIYQYTASIRCTNCNARGPTVSTWAERLDEETKRNLTYRAMELWELRRI